MNLQLNRVICGDSAKELKKLPNEYIDLTITSPPYDELREYHGHSWDLSILIGELFRVTKEGGVCVWIVGDSVKDGSETLNSFKQALGFQEHGWNIHDTMIFEKNASSLPDPTRYNQRFQYMFVFSKGKPKTINLIEDVKNNRSGELKQSRTVREKDGITYPRKEHTVKEYSRRGNIWKYNTGWMHSTKDKIAFDHPAIFPEDLVKDHILSWSNEGDLILDPFAGSGTTLKMAKLTNRNYLGIEISKEYCDIIHKRLERYNNHNLEVFQV